MLMLTLKCIEGKKRDNKLIHETYEKVAITDWMSTATIIPETVFKRYKDGFLGSML